MPLADQTRFAQNVVEQSERMQRTVDRLLELSKLEGMSAPAKPDAIELHALLKALIANAQSRDSNVQIQLSGEADAVVRGNREQIELALANLIDNAIAFSPHGVAIRCEVSRAAQNVSVDVIDEGPGFAEFAAEKIGERFVSSPRPDGSPKSSGLGLAIAKQVAELHGGTLSLVSAKNPTRVRLVFPT
jgi:two-component system sensor histidine kinase CreC